MATPSRPADVAIAPNATLGPSQAHAYAHGGEARSPRLPPSPILLHPLPPSSAFEKESIFQSELELDRQIRQLTQEKALAEALQDAEWTIERRAVREEQGTWSRSQVNGKGKEKVGNGDWGSSKPFERPPQAYELYKAIDRRDIDHIMRVRDHAFPLLLQKNGEFPILYAARIGDSHRDVVILLIGALSRYVNNLEPEDFEKKETQNILKALRANLKLAIDNSLLPSSSSPSFLLSSYLQVLIMSEGDSWLLKSVNDLSLILRTYLTSSPGIGDKVRPVKEAESMVRKFCTKELRGVPGGVSGVEEYISNAALDLIIMSSWSIAAGQLSLDYLPTHAFARDLRTWSLFSDEMTVNSTKLNKLNPRIRKILEQLLDLGGDTVKGVRGRLRDVRSVLDGEDE